MKVRIQHSINLEDVPEKAHELLMPVEEKLDNAMRWLNALSRDLATNSISADLASTSIDRIRKALGECDFTLREVESIMQGVSDYEKEMLLPPSQPTTSSSVSNNSPPAQQATGDDEQTEFNNMLEALAREKRDALLKEKELKDEPDLPF